MLWTLSWDDTSSFTLGFKDKCLRVWDGFFNNLSTAFTLQAPQSCKGLSHFPSYFSVWQEPVSPWQPTSDVYEKLVSDHILKLKRIPIPPAETLGRKRVVQQDFPNKQTLDVLTTLLSLLNSDTDSVVPFKNSWLC